MASIKRMEYEIEGWTNQKIFCGRFNKYEVLFSRCLFWIEWGWICGLQQKV